MSSALYRDRQRGWIGGVCAGLAEHLGLPVFLVRLLALPLFVTPLLPFAVIAYVVAVARIPPRPPAPQPDPDRQRFEASAAHAPAATFGRVRQRLRDVEERIRRLEAYVTSPAFSVDDELRRRR